MIGAKQEQNVENNSTALQAGRDIHYHGFSVSDIKELCSLFLANNFPILREEAKQAAKEFVREFGFTLENKLIENANEIDLNKFREPDVQAAINDAVQACARKGNAASPEILAAIISERISKNSNEYKDIVLGEAVQVVPKLTANQISFLALQHFVSSMIISGVNGVSGLEHWGAKVLSVTKNGFGLSDSQKKHIEYTGALSINTLVGGDIYSELAVKSYKYLNFSDGNQFKIAVGYMAPSFKRILDIFNEENLFRYNLTSVGQAIALTHLGKSLGKLDYTIWLK